MIITQGYGTSGAVTNVLSVLEVNVEVDDLEVAVEVDEINVAVEVEDLEVGVEVDCE